MVSTSCRALLRVPVHELAYDSQRHHDGGDQVRFCTVPRRASPIHDTSALVAVDGSNLIVIAMPVFQAATVQILSVQAPTASICSQSCAK
jgi:hypothetical protein